MHNTVPLLLLISESSAGMCLGPGLPHCGEKQNEVGTDQAGNTDNLQGTSHCIERGVLDSVFWGWVFVPGYPRSSVRSLDC